MTLTASIIGGSGYTGGELIRLLLGHPNVELTQVTSRSYAGKPITRVNPNLRGQSKLKFADAKHLQDVDVMFLCLPHGVSSETLNVYQDHASKIIDLSSDFRLKDNQLRQRYYGNYDIPPINDDFVYGIPELQRAQISKASLVATAGCNATVSILALLPLLGILGENPRFVIDMKVGSSESGRLPNSSSHYSERFGSIRSYKPTHHRHEAEIIEHLSLLPNQVNMSATSIQSVRGASATIHCFYENQELTEKSIWQSYRRYAAAEPFIRIVKENSGNYRYPDIKTIAGSNFCDIGFELDVENQRLVCLAAIDNLMKGSAGQAVQCMNLMFDLQETMGLTFPGIFPN